MNKVRKLYLPPVGLGLPTCPMGNQDGVVRARHSALASSRGQVLCEPVSIPLEAPPLLESRLGWLYLKIFLLHTRTPEHSASQLKPGAWSMSEKSPLMSST